MIIDSHVHVYPNNKNSYPSAIPGKPEGSPTVEFLLETQDAAGVGRAVIVQPDSYDDPVTTKYVADCLKRYPDRLAACGLINPQAPDAVERLEHQVKDLGFGGTRLYLSRHKNPMELAYPDQDRLWQKVEELDVCFIVLASAQDLPYLEPMIARHPGVKVVIDHMGRPPVWEQEPFPLLTNITKLAKYPQVFVKISNMHGLSKTEFPHPDTHGIARALYNAFGPQRLMWGTDFPGVTRKIGYARAVDLILNHLDFLSSEDREWLLEKTARSVWRFAGD